MAQKSIADLLAQAEKYQTDLEFELIMPCFDAALEKSPEDPQVLDAFSEHLISVGVPERAQQMIKKSIELAPELNGSKYFNLAELSAGEEAVEIYKKGIEVRTKEAQASGE